MNKFRDNSVYLSSEVYQMVKILAKAANNDTDAGMTADQMADCILRETITRLHPELVILGADLDKARQDAKKSYHAIEDKMIKACLSPTAVSSQMVGVSNKNPCGLSDP